ncbi:ABC transporter permease [Capillimicrobium parvum]|uniref:Macrolide export ATP-binding/permease protein MacB n=1 Tax=Capillimicrobium parvum TaxID=2884022 RepID=A0A9E7C2L4_9ACTN|nr:ABC transporter permease [Capillimicrobium parvum]UGS37573.1 Macrolide export ATP-binding/permease protein MacB [Capillimicrobium parvum]
MLRLVFTNLTRRKGRTIATAIGIALGVATIVALLSIGAGLKRTAAEFVHLGQSDFGLFQAGIADPTASILPTELATKLERRPDVSAATPLLLVVEGVKQDPAAVVFGAEPDGFFAQRLVVTRGRHALGPGQILVGDQLARRLKLGPGDTMRVKTRAFRVAGVYHTGIFFEDTGAVLDLRSAQKLTHRRRTEATNIVVQLAPGARQKQVEAAVGRANPGTLVIGTPEEAARVGANGELVRKTVTIVAALALIVGGLGVTNTMAMAVMERQRELALLSAVGWKRVRIASLVLAEGVATSIIGAGFGMLLGIIGADALNQALSVSSVVSPQVTFDTVWQALAIGVAIGILGGLYPAWRGTSVSPLRLLGGGP